MMFWATALTYAGAPWRGVIIIGFVLGVIGYEICQLVKKND